RYRLADADAGGHQSGLPTFNGRFARVSPVSQRGSDYFTSRAVGVDMPEDIGRGHHGQRDLPRRERVDREAEQVVDEHEHRYEECEQAVLGVRQLDRQRVTGWAEVDKPGPVDVVVGA